MHPPIHFPPYLLLALLLPLLPPTTPTTITFSSALSHPISTQRCTTDSYPDICCIPLDITLPTTQTYDWFRPTHATFSDLTPARSSRGPYMAVYSNDRSTGPCAGQAVAQQFGGGEWTASVRGALVFKQFSGAVVAKTWRPVWMDRRWPEVVVIEGRSFRYMGMEGEVFLFKDAEGRMVRGRTFGGGGLTRGGNLTEGMVGNGTAGIDVSVE